LVSRPNERAQALFRKSETTVLRKLFGPERDEVMGNCREVHMRSSRDDTLPDVITMIKLRMTRLEGHVARMGK